MESRKKQQRRTCTSLILHISMPTCPEMATTTASSLKAIGRETKGKVERSGWSEGPSARGKQKDISLVGHGERKESRHDSQKRRTL